MQLEFINWFYTVAVIAKHLIDFKSVTMFN